MKKALILFLLGGVANLALAPFYFFPVLFLSFWGFLKYLGDATTKRQAFWTGWWFGFGYFVLGLYWISNSLLVDMSFAWLIPFSLTLIPAAASVFIGLAAVGYRVLSGRNILVNVLLLSALWTLTEIARTYIPFGGFPWNLIGYTALASLEISQLAAFGGVYLLSFLVVFIACVGYVHKSKIYLVLYFVILLGGWAWGKSYIKYIEQQKSGKEIAVRVVQPNIEQEVKWKPMKMNENFVDTLNLSTEGDFDKFDFVIWPESSVPFHVNREHLVLEKIKTIVPKNGSLILGAQRSQGNSKKDFQVWNSIYFINKNGIDKYYDKHHLVPFGEYVPFRNYLPLDKITPGAVDFSVGALPQVMGISNSKILPLICYEIIFPSLANTQERPDFMVNLTNDGWYGDTSGPQQHLAMTQMRAIEQAVPIIRAANTGVSAIISPTGKIVSKKEYGEKGVIDETLKLPNIKGTIYSSYNLNPVLLLIFFSVLFSVFWRKK